MKTKRFYKIASVIIAVTMMCTPLTMLPVSAATSDSVNVSVSEHTTKNDLQTAMKLMGSIDGANWSDESWAVYLEACSYAYKVINDPNATQEDIDTAGKLLGEAISQLKECERRDVLWDAIERAESVDSTLYTEESYKKICDMIFYAKATYYFEGTQSVIDDTIKQLNDAVDGLVTLKDDKILNLVDKYLSDNYSEKVLEDFPASIGTPSDESYNGFYLVYTQLPFAAPMINTFNIKGYTFEVDYIFEPSHLEHLAVNPETQEVLPLETALRSGKIDIEEWISNNESYTKYAKMNLTGDADFDGKLTIKDVTSMQKILAGIQAKTDKYINEDTFYDINGDKNFSIADATYLQKALIK